MLSGSSGGHIRRATYDSAGELIDPKDHLPAVSPSSHLTPAQRILFGRASRRSSPVLPDGVTNLGDTMASAPRRDPAVARELLRWDSRDMQSAILSLPCVKAQGASAPSTAPSTPLARSGASTPGTPPGGGGSGAGTPRTLQPIHHKDVIRAAALQLTEQETVGGLKRLIKARSSSSMPLDIPCPPRRGLEMLRMDSTEVQIPAPMPMPMPMPMTMSPPSLRPAHLPLLPPLLLPPSPPKQTGDRRTPTK